MSHTPRETCTSRDTGLDEQTSVKETPSHMKCQDLINTSRTTSACTNGKNGEILLKPWTKRQTSPCCGKLLKELMAEQNAMQRTYYLQWMLVSSSKQLATKFNQQFNTSKMDRHTSLGETQILRMETIIDGNIHLRSKNGTNQEP